MHEMSIIEALLDAVRQELRAHSGACVRSVRIRVGELRRVEPSLLQFCYEAAVRNTTLAGSALEIEPVAAAAWCPHCKTEFPVAENWFVCPRCDATNVTLVRGNELELASIELELPNNGVCGAAAAAADSSCGEQTPVR